ncbi:DegV family protein [Allocoprobacillus halotolerans]|uniref:DegV family protein n=1 Tax=Allocoprobacillus halotolerans TaxID=2944914 RepID=A0ABY5I498_9FIRM|nr:DegV family protein [Allocoprobacillus halotolerans]UTY38878.1 DegV family protein [Allocoprobacillus halotolerans]
MYQIVSDGSCDLEQSLVEKYHIQVVPFYITVDGVHHQKEKRY